MEKKQITKSVELGINTSVSAMFGQYFNACYPNGCPQNQRDEIKQAFYSGIFSYLVLTLSDKMPDDEDEAVKAVQSIYDECERVLKARLNR